MAATRWSTATAGAADAENAIEEHLSSGTPTIGRNQSKIAFARYLPGLYGQLHSVPAPVA